MSNQTQLTETEKKRIFWASFLSLASAGVGFTFRVLYGGAYGADFELTSTQVGLIFGASLWPIALTMIGFSLFLHKTGFKIPMYVAFALQGTSAILTCFATDFNTIWFAAFLAGLGHGIVEAVINPVCVAIYPKQKTKMLTILHAAWPVGLAGGGLLMIMTNSVLSWQIQSLWILIPITVYGYLFIHCRFPQDERIKAGVPYIDMLRLVGFLSASLVSFLMVYEIGSVWSNLGHWTLPSSWFIISLIVGLVIGVAFGCCVKAFGNPLFFLMCLLMIPVATAELATDGWIKGLMTPILDGNRINPGLAIVFSATIMLIGRVYAGGILKFFSPPVLLTLSGLFSAVGLIWLSSATSVAIFIAFVLYAMGQTFYWPCVLGFVSERYPKGGALTLNAVSAIGLLSVGIIGGPLLGVQFDKLQHSAAKKSPALAEVVEQASQDESFLIMNYKSLDPERTNEIIATDKKAGNTLKNIKDESGRGVLKYAAIFPGILVIAFGCISLYFRKKGGYKPVEI